jgi:hypothetical protein
MSAGSMMATSLRSLSNTNNNLILLHYMNAQLRSRRRPSCRQNPGLTVSKQRVIRNNFTLQTSHYRQDFQIKADNKAAKKTVNVHPLFAHTTQRQPEKMNPKAPRRLDLQQIFTWLMADGLILKDEAKAKYNEAQGILKNGAIHHAPVDGNRAM